LIFSSYNTLISVTYALNNKTMGVKCSGATFNMTLPVLGIQLLLTMRCVM